MRYFFFLLCLVALSCNKDEVVLTPEQQLAHDIEVIDNYIASKHTPNVIKDPSGLRYVIHVLGDGPLAGPQSYLKVKYTGAFLPSEDVFDESLVPPTYFFFKLEQIIEGWRIAFQHLPQGSTATLYIPSGLAYGAQGPLPPNSNLIFLVEFIDFYIEGQVMDAGSNIYTQVLTRDQLWLSPNLTSSKYANGEDIDPLHWSHYEDDPSYELAYGKLYSYAAVTDPRKLCPTGYRIPTRSEWERLSAIMDTDERNAIELTPGGNREANGTYSGEGVKGVFWASDDLAETDDVLTFVYLPTTTLTSSVVSPDIQASVRCIKGF